MAIKTIEYEVNIAGITPATEQFGGTQGDHRVTQLNYELMSELYDGVESAKGDGKAMYRFDVYDGEGGIWQSEPKELAKNVQIVLEERHTRHGGKITVYLVITVLSEENQTEMELYSFPCILRLKNRPDGEYQDAKNHESIVGLVEIAKATVADAALYCASAQEAELATREFASEVEQKLANGEFDGKDGVSVTHSFDGTVLKMTSASGTTMVDLKGEKGEQGPKGDKGDKGSDGEITNLDQTYSPTSENAQSGKAVAGAVDVAKSQSIPRPKCSGAPTTQVLVFDDMYLTDENGNFTYLPDYLFGRKHIDDGRVDGGKTNTASHGGWLVARDNKGNLFTGNPIDERDCANKKYVDDIVGDIETTLTKIAVVLGGI